MLPLEAKELPASALKTSDGQGFLGIFHFWEFSVLIAILGVSSFFSNSANFHSANFLTPIFI
jgi:hypothetical protein